MADLLLLLTMFVVCGGIGLPIAELVPSTRFAWRLLLLPSWDSRLSRSLRPSRIGPA